MDLANLLGGMGMGGGNFGQMGQQEVNIPDTGETVQISALALIKMLKHARAGIPFEVMGLLIGEIVDDYTIKVVDVFSMP